MRRRIVAIGLLGTTLDRESGKARWERWRPTVALCAQDEFEVARLELLHAPEALSLAQVVAADIRRVAPGTAVRLRPLSVADPWDFEAAYAALDDFARGYPFDTAHEEYLVHITTGTHVEQICWFLLVESRRLSARLVQTSPPPGRRGHVGATQVIDLDLSRYDRLARRAAAEHTTGASFLKAGIATRNAAFNRLIERIERVAVSSTDPLLLTGPTGAGKTELARRIYELKRARRQVSGPFVEVNCATLRGDAAMSALFGHVKGAFTEGASVIRFLLTWRGRACGPSRRWCGRRSAGRSSRRRLRPSSACRGASYAAA